MPSLIPRTPWARRLVYELIYLWPGVHRWGTFNVGFGPTEPGIESRQIQLYAELFKQIPWDVPHWQRSSCLELAAGGGGGLLYLKAHRRPTETIGIDLSYVAAWRGRRLGVDVRQGDVVALPFEDRRFDCVFCTDALGYFPVAAVMKEAFRVLKPGGHLLLGEPFHGTPAAAEAHFRRIASDGGFEFRHFRDASDGVRRSIEAGSTGKQPASWLPAAIRDGLKEMLSLEGSDRLQRWRSGAYSFAIVVFSRPA